MARPVPTALAAAALFGSALAIAPSVSAEPPFPEVVELPDATTADGSTTPFMPEGIVTRGPIAYVGSIPTGDVVRVDLRDGGVRPLVEGESGDASIGLALDPSGQLLFVAGGPTGELRVADARTGEVLRTYDLPGAGFVNDVTVTAQAAYVTDSTSDQLYVVPLDGRELGDARSVTLGGDFEVADGFNANGVVAARPGTLVLAQSTDPQDGEGSALYRVDVDLDAGTADAQRIAVRGGEVENADGLVLRGRTLSVVENRSNTVTQLRLSGDLTSARVVDVLADEDFSVPTTADVALGALYAVNAQFGVDPAVDGTYEVVRVED